MDRQLFTFTHQLANQLVVIYNRQLARYYWSWSCSICIIVTKYYECLYVYTHNIQLHTYSYAQLYIQYCSYNFSLHQLHIFYIFFLHQLAIYSYMSFDTGLSDYRNSVRSFSYKIVQLQLQISVVEYFLSLLIFVVHNYFIVSSHVATQLLCVASNFSLQILI